MADDRTLPDIIRTRIEEAGGFLPLNEFMQAALYEPELGYYETRTVFGEQGDFVTASELGPWSTLAMADLVFDCWRQLGEPTDWTLIEQGSGSGRQLASLLEIVMQLEMGVPARIISVEHCGSLRQRQSELFSGKGLSVEIVATLDEVQPAENVIYYSNELPDAFPVPCFHFKDGSFYERGVAVDGDGFGWIDRETPMQTPPAIAPELIAGWPASYISEYNPAVVSWQQSLSRMIESGFVITVDYGYSQQEYYREARREGTLMAHMGQTASEDVLTDPGSRDITAHVDFTALLKAGEDVGFEALLWMSQGGWLAQSPSVQSLLQSLANQNDKVSMHLLAHAKRLLMPFGMGEVFKLLLQSKGVDAKKPAYLTQFDHLDQLRA